MGEIEKVDFGVKEQKGRIITTSRKVAQVFEKRHDHVLRDIENIISSLKIEERNLTVENSATNFAPQNWGTNFIQSEYKLRGRKYPEYLLTKDGLTLLAMGFTGEKALRFKMAYINEFNRMEQQLKALQMARLEYPEMTDAIQEAHEEPKSYHYSNEANLINRIVLGMDAKKFREAYGLEKNESIRPFVSADQIRLIGKLQKYNTVLIETGIDYHERKRMLEEYHKKLTSIKLVSTERG